jgi:hypothetical protein
MLRGAIRALSLGVLDVIFTFIRFEWIFEIKDDNVVRVRYKFAENVAVALICTNIKSTGILSFVRWI